MYTFHLRMNNIHTKWTSNDMKNDIGRACLMEVGYKFGLWELVNFYSLGILIRKKLNMQKCVEEDFCGENPGIRQEMEGEWLRHK